MCKILWIRVYYFKLESTNVFVFTDEKEDLIHFKVVFKSHLTLSTIPNIVNLPNLLIPHHFHIMSLSFYESDLLLVIGSRAGCLAVYHLDRQVTPVVVFRHLHNSDVITSILITKLDISWLVRTVGRDGCYSKCVLQRGEEHQVSHLESSIHGWTLDRTFHSKITKGWLSRVQHNLP